MYTTVQKWGHSNAIRLPKGILDEADIHENDRVEIKTVQDVITIRRVSLKHKTLAERLQDYSGQIRCREWKTGEAIGKEVW